MSPSDRIATAFVDACLLDVAALKPGNVGLHGPGHRMGVLDFVRSARAAAPAIAAPGASIGQRIVDAVIATQAAVGTNTNLGIVLLAAPIAQAALDLHGDVDPERLRQRIGAVLSALTVDDAAAAFRAIRIANPGGLGHSDEHDVHAPPQVTLLTAMQAAADRDLVARQYATGYAAIFDTGIPALHAVRARGWDRPQAATAVFLAFLRRYPDSHVGRKLAADVATAVLHEAGRFDLEATAVEGLSAV
ncbi:MAG: triphosphoribosyl-dephospho-CoA synthase, partial [Burkholderiales bacterium]|nr:triphosphoribosyl-dephospho-CoA synthase [Burkholderiales bacterium]